MSPFRPRTRRDFKRARGEFFSSRAIVETKTRPMIARVSFRVPREDRFAGKTSRAGASQPPTSCEARNNSWLVRAMRILSIADRIRVPTPSNFREERVTTFRSQTRFIPGDGDRETRLNFESRPHKRRRTRGVRARSNG